jgi:hypothetical protein
VSYGKRADGCGPQSGCPRYTLVGKARPQLVTRADRIEKRRDPCGSPLNDTATQVGALFCVLPTAFLEDTIPIEGAC